MNRAEVADTRSAAARAAMDDALAEAHRLHAHGRATFDAAALDSAERRFRYLAPRAAERSGEIHFALGGTLAALGRHDEALAL